jgi:peptide/nickel transport system substrate-binding protein
MSPPTSRRSPSPTPAADPAARQTAFTAVQKLLVKDMPQVWIMEMAFPTISQKKLHNVVELGTGTHASFDDVFIS